VNGVDAQPVVTVRSILEERASVFAEWARRVPEQPGKKKVAHQLRTNARRLEAAVKGLRDGLKTKQAKGIVKTVKTLRRTAGEARDADVLGKRVAKQLERTHEPSRSAALGYLVGHMGKRRDGATDRLLKQVGKAESDIASLTERLVSCAKAEEKAPPLREVARDGLREAAMRFAHASEQDLTDIHLLHELRKDGKRLRYTVELFEPLMPAALAQEALARMTDFQERLGSINDQHVMLELLLAVRERHDSGAVERGLTLLHDELRREHDREHASFVRWWWDRGAAAQMLGCAHVLSSEGPEAAVA
jgi:CHAD domain-containing protein